MKKLFALALAAALVSPAFADVVETEETDTNLELGLFEVAAAQAPDVVGLRLTIPFSTRQESVTGFDIGFWGRAQYFEGCMCSILRNDVKDELTGIQVGLYNSAAQADLIGAQVGLWNEVGSMRGAQVGLVNVGGNVQGFQVGLINRSEELYGFQVGLVNVIRDAEIRFCPFVNIGF